MLDAYMRAFREAAETYQLTGEPDLNALLAHPGDVERQPPEVGAPEEVRRRSSS